MPFGKQAAALVSIIGDGLVSVDERGTIVLFNNAAESMFGYDAAEVLGRPVELLMPHRFRHSHEVDVQNARDLALGTRRAMGHQREVIGLRKNGEEFPAAATLCRSEVEGGLILTAVIRDITEQKRRDEERQLLTSEVSHRFKNLMAVVNSIVSLTGRGVSSVSEFRSGLQGRLRAVSRTHEALLQTEWSGADLHLLIEAELASYRNGAAANISLCGAPLVVPAQQAATLTLLFHELATNAAKYGSLSCSEGTLRVSWKVITTGTATTLLMDWIESGGPPVRAPERRGFGTQLIERLMRGPTSGIMYHPHGLRCRLELPLR